MFLRRQMQRNVTEVPEKHKLASYRSMVARLRFAETWVRFDISHTVGQLARFCALAGSSHFAALHHLMEYLEKHPSFKLDYYKCPTKPTGLDGYCDADWERATTVDRSLVTSSGTTELRSHGNPSFRSRWRFQLLSLGGGVLLGIAWRGEGHLSASTAAGYGLRTHISDAGV